jgi:hypothetical protein
MWWKFYVLMYVNGKMRPENYSRNGGRGKGE